MIYANKKPKHQKGFHSLENLELPNGNNARVLIWHLKGDPDENGDSSGYCQPGNRSIIRENGVVRSLSKL